MSAYNEKVIRKKLKVYGSVQGVGFRYRAEYAAKLLGVAGWVRNDPDGAVSMELQGTEEQIDKMLEMINRGTYVEISGMEVRRLSVAEDECGFRAEEYGNGEEE